MQNTFYLSVKKFFIKNYKIFLFKYNDKRLIACILKNYLIKDRAGKILRIFLTLFFYCINTYCITQFKQKQRIICGNRIRFKEMNRYSDINIER